MQYKPIASSEWKMEVSCIYNCRIISVIYINLKTKDHSKGTIFFVRRNIKVLFICITWDEKYTSSDLASIMQVKTMSFIGTGFRVMLIKVYLRCNCSHGNLALWRCLFLWSTVLSRGKLLVLCAPSAAILERIWITFQCILEEFSISFRRVMG